MAVVGRTAPHRGAVAALLEDPEWAGKPLWMLNLLSFKGGHGGEGEASYARYLEAQGDNEAERRLVMKGHCRTLIGTKEYHQMTLVAYPSPEAFARMGKSDAYAARNQELRLAGLAEQVSHSLTLSLELMLLHMCAHSAARLHSTSSR